MRPLLKLAAKVVPLFTLMTNSPVVAAPDSAEAAQLFAEAQAICARDEARLWGLSLCGPILLVDYTDRKVIANQADAQGRLTHEGSIFLGVLPDDVIIANTATEWAGTRWTQLIAPSSSEPMNRHVTLAHELFHRVQTSLRLSREETSNRHLDTLEGRFLLQLEWRALARALTATSSNERRAAIVDAMAFRHERGRRFPAAAVDEAALEINEGIPEYTGVMLGLATSQERIAYAVYDLSRFVEAPSFVRSFAYATGPALGLLLDGQVPDWRTRIRLGARLDELLGSATDVAAETRELDQRIARYDGDHSLRASEERRDHDRRGLLADYRSRLVDGPVLSLPNLHANFQFNPQALIPLDGVGTVYPKLGIVDDWGSLEVSDGGALVLDRFSGASVSARGIATSHLSGPGWQLTLKPGWSVVAGGHAGSFVLVRDDPGIR